MFGKAKKELSALTGRIAQGDIGAIGELNDWYISKLKGAERRNWFLGIIAQNMGDQASDALIDVADSFDFTHFDEDELIVIKNWLENLHNQGKDNERLRASLSEIEGIFGKEAAAAAEIVSRNEANKIIMGLWEVHSMSKKDLDPLTKAAVSAGAAIAFKNKHGREPDEFNAVVAGLIQNSSAGAGQEVGGIYYVEGDTVVIEYSPVDKNGNRFSSARNTSGKFQLVSESELIIEFEEMGPTKFVKHPDSW